MIQDIVKENWGKQLRECEKSTKEPQVPFLYRMEGRTLLVNFSLLKYFVEVLKCAGLVRKIAHQNVGLFTNSTMEQLGSCLIMPFF